MYTLTSHARVYTKVCASCCHPSPASRRLLRAGAAYGDEVFKNLVLYVAVTDGFCVLRFECSCRARRFENVAPIVRLHLLKVNIREQLSPSSTC